MGLRCARSVRLLPELGVGGGLREGGGRGSGLAGRGEAGGGPRGGSGGVWGVLPGPSGSQPGLLPPAALSGGEGRWQGRPGPSPGVEAAGGPSGTGGGALWGPPVSGGLGGVLT